MKLITIVCLPLVLLLNCSVRSTPRVAGTDAIQRPENRPYTTNNLKDTKTQSTSQTVQLVQMLQSEDEHERSEAKNRLLFIAKESAPSRQEIISELIKIVDKSDTRQRVLESMNRFEIWKSIVLLLGELKAKEALPALLTCLDCTGEVGGLSLSHYPATKAVIMIGNDAVPGLTEALGNSNPSIRKYAALALGEIGGEEAKKSLESAFQTEQDDRVKYIIEKALINVKR